MLVHSDVKGLEVVCAAFLSRDPVLSQEIWDNKNNPEMDDLHTTNRKEFDLPDRTTAKRFTFKILYGGTDFGFSVDPKFNHVSTDRHFWSNVIERFYTKYSGIRRWHESLLRIVLDKGQLSSPTGRTFIFDRKDVAQRTWFWLPKIKNYLVQSLGADLVAIGRVTAWKRLKNTDLPHLWVSTVHDSLDLDVKIILDKGQEVCDNICSIIKASVEAVPTNFERLFGVKFDLPITADISYGPNLAELT